MKKIKINLTVNNRDYEIEVDPNLRLVDLLREEFNLLGTKEGCGVGECGACTVIMNNSLIHSCMVLVGQAQNAEIVTIEGVAGESTKLHPIQEAFIEAGAVQCGYCTPGMVLSAKVLLGEKPNHTIEEIKEGISGNLCRCTGYQQIIEAVQLAAKKLQNNS